MALLKGKLTIEIEYPAELRGLFLYLATPERSSTALVWSKPTTAVPGQAKKTSKSKTPSLG